MQCYPSTPHPPPDLGRSPSLALPVVSQHFPQQSQSAPSFLIIGLFALRLVKELIQSLDDYPARITDIAWLTQFLSAYHADYALAKIIGPRKDDYVVMYQSIVSRMKKQPRYPIRFMQMNPDPSAQQRQAGRGEEQVLEMSDEERLAIVDFCDAAGEWGSIVPIPAREAARMIELADQRRIADLDSVQ